MLRTTIPVEHYLQGLWRNELGSSMTLLALNTTGTFLGFYHTAVTAANKQILLSPLQGAQQHPSAKRHPIFAFTVQWQFSDSTTALVGQCFVDHSGKETLETTWLLREEVTSHRDTWKATR
ncbi:avidin-like [Empidonax traillii]|uniref:avidin-like n=1 Tax=Empidonax traillii TaxID=164674 RepID=UPI000FFCFEAA|nr:avidin-like [Empidonax traillii]